MINIDASVLEAIKKSENIAIVTHIRPDADALGSSSALKLALEALGKKADIFCDSDIATTYNFIKYACLVNKPKLSLYDTYISLDCADEGRLGKYATNFKKCANSINIDHHITNTNFANVNFVREVSSTGEILYYVINQLGVELNTDIANSLYAAISSDTGCFQHNNTTANVHRIVAHLMEYEINISIANYYLFKRRTLEQVQLLQLALKNLKFFENNRIALIYLREEDFKACNIKNPTTDGLVDIAINIENVEVGILISEIKPNLFSCSLRRKDKVDVSEIAKVFGGGGHAFAAGCNIFGTYKSVTKKLIKACKEPLSRIEN